MKLEDFIEKYNGKKVDFDGAFGAQCVDLFRQYNSDVFNFPHTGAVEGAKDLFLNYDKLPKERAYYDRIPETGSVGRIGDVVIWNGTETNKYGHVAIFLGYVAKSFVLVFEQDGFKQDGAKITVRKKDNLLGYLRKK